MPTPKLQCTTVARPILNWNQTISVQQSLCAFHVGLASCQLAGEKLAGGAHHVTISPAFGVMRPESTDAGPPGCP